MRRALLQTVLTSGQLVEKHSLFCRKGVDVSKMLQIKIEVRTVYINFPDVAADFETSTVNCDF